MFVIFLCGDTRLNWIAGWFCIVMGVGTSDGGRYSKSTWHFRQSNSRAILSARQQVRRGWFRWPFESVSSGLPGRNGSTVLRKNLTICLKKLGSITWYVCSLSALSNLFQTYQCHSKVTSDFVFLGACSLVATAGHGSEGRNVALWDTLLPQNKSLVQGTNNRCISYT